LECHDSWRRWFTGIFSTRRMGTVKTWIKDVKMWIKHTINPALSIHKQ
jgi:hypothetical protein